MSPKESAINHWQGEASGTGRSVRRQFDEPFKRLHIAGKPPKVVITAVMRKLLHILWRIAKSGQPRRTTLSKSKIIIATT